MNLLHRYYVTEVLLKVFCHIKDLGTQIIFVFDLMQRTTLVYDII